MSVLVPAKDGGKPVRSQLLPYGRQSIDESDIEEVSRALRSPHITRGPYVEKLEASLASLSEQPYALCFTSATTALHAVMAYAKISKGDSVVTTPNTFIATANSIRYQNGDVVFSDIDSKTLNLDPKKINAKNFKALVSVDFAGNPCALDQFKSIAVEQRALYINDASHSLGAIYQKKPIGTFADITVYSFHPVKQMTTGEGGAIVCSSKDAYEFLKLFRNHGLVKEPFPGTEHQEILGWNYHMTEMQAALGVSQLKRLSSFIQKRKEIAKKYTEAFLDVTNIESPSVTEGAESVWHLYPLRLQLNEWKISRDDVIRAFHAENIGVSLHYIPVYWHPYYQGLGYSKGICPQAEVEFMRSLTLPIFPTMTDQDVKDVIDSVHKLAAFYKKSF